MSHKEAIALGEAAWLQLQSITIEYQAAVLRGYGQDDLEPIRRRAHDVIDRVLDLKGDAATATRAIIGL